MVSPFWPRDFGSHSSKGTELGVRESGPVVTLFRIIFQKFKAFRRSKPLVHLAKAAAINTLNSRQGFSNLGLQTLNYNSHKPWAAGPMVGASGN